jgi:hypothetical protein
MKNNKVDFKSNFICVFYLRLKLALGEVFYLGGSATIGEIYEYRK